MEPHLVNLPEIDFLRICLQEIQDSLLCEAMIVVAVAVMPLRTLKPVTEPTNGNPFLNYVAVLAPIRGT